MLWTLARLIRIWRERKEQHYVNERNDGLTGTLMHARGTAISVDSALKFTSCTGGRVSGYGNNVFSIVGGVGSDPTYAPFFLKGSRKIQTAYFFGGVWMGR